jgi:hypothetical protein
VIQSAQHGGMVLYVGGKPTKAMCVTCREIHLVGVDHDRLKIPPQLCIPCGQRVLENSRRIYAAERRRRIS